jgi:PD-(D/E)XK endonuclease
MTPREQGDFGELSAMQWLVEQGGHLYMPHGHSPDIDIVAEFDGRLLSIEVKTAGSQDKKGRWLASICTRGGNQSWSGVVKKFDPARCDFLFVLVGDGRRWFIPTDVIECETSITLGGPKYSEFEVEPGLPLRRDPVPEPAVLDSTLAPGGVSEWLKEMRCKRIGSAYTGSNPVSPIDSQVYLRPPEAPGGRVGTAKIWGKRRVTIPESACRAAGLAIGDRLEIVCEGDGRLVVRRIAPADRLESG